MFKAGFNIREYSRIFCSFNIRRPMGILDLWFHVFLDQGQRSGQNSILLQPLVLKCYRTELEKRTVFKFMDF